MYNKRPRYGWFYVLAIVLPALSIWLNADLTGSVDLLQQAKLWLAADPWQVFWIYGAVSLIWMLLGRNLLSSHCRFAYPFAGAWGVNAVFLLAIDGGLHTQCGKLLGICVSWFRDTLAGSVLFWICFAVAAIVLIVLNLEQVMDFVFGVLDLLSLRGIWKVLRFLGGICVYWFAFTALLRLGSLWVWVIGMTVLAFVLCLFWRSIERERRLPDPREAAQNQKKKGSVLNRIFKDILFGMIVTLTLYFGLSMVWAGLTVRWEFISNIQIIQFDVQEMFFTELSLAFLVISFVPLLSNKTESVYWVDIIQYRLIKPKHTSIVDISAYVFANLILSLVAFIFPELRSVLLISFVVTIFFLGFLSVKLLVSFFGVEHLKEELKKEYQMALEYRKLVCELSQESDFSFYFSNNNPYSKRRLTSFGSQLEIRTETLQSMHDELLQRKKFKKRVLSRNKAYRKLAHLARKFDYKVDKFEVMRDGLYANVIKCIDEYKVNEVCEQILLLLQYEEYDYAMDCVEKVLQHSPMVFLKLFEDSLQDVPRDEKLLAFMNEKLYGLLSGDEDAAAAKYKIAINEMANWATGYVSQKKLEKQLAEAVRQKKYGWVAALYQAGFLKPVHKLILEVNRTLRTADWTDALEKTLKNAFSWEVGTRLIADSLTNGESGIAYTALWEYNHFLENLNTDLNSSWYGVSDYIRKGMAFQAEICDLAEIFELASARHDIDLMSTFDFVQFIRLLIESYQNLRRPYIYKYATIQYPALLEGYKTSLIQPMIQCVRENDWAEKAELLELLQKL